jgi:hypothetical protein
MRIGSERAGNTWHGKVGYDFVAAYTSVYTEYPLQMFDRDMRVLDTAYLLLRKFSLYDDVIMPRVRSLRTNMVTTVKSTTIVAGVERVAYNTAPVYASDADAKAAVVNAIVVNDADGTKMNLGTKNDDQLKAMVFFQYMPCSSRAFVKYHETLKLVDARVEANNPGKFAGLLAPTQKDRIGVRNNYASKVLLGELLEARVDAYVNGEIYKKDRVREHDAVRFLDVLMCAGAWKIGKVIDTRSARATPYANGPTNASYRMTVVMDMEWLQRNKSIDITRQSQPADVPGTVNELGRSLSKPPAYWASKGRTYAEKSSLERSTLAAMSVQTLSERELYEAPLAFGLFAAGAAAGAAAAAAVVAAAPFKPSNVPPTLYQRGETAYNSATALKDKISAKQDTESTKANARLNEVQSAVLTGYGFVRQAKADLDDPAINTAQLPLIVEGLELADSAFKAVLDTLDLPGDDYPEYDAMLDAVINWAGSPFGNSKEAAYIAAEKTYDAAVEASLQDVADEAGFDFSKLALPSDRLKRHVVFSKAFADIRAMKAAKAAAPLTAAVASITPVHAPPKPVGKPVTASAATSKSVAPKSKQPAAPPPGVDSSPLMPTAASAPTTRKTAASSGSSLVNETIAASKKAVATSSQSAKSAAAPAPAAAAAPPRTQGVVDAVFDTIFGASADTVQRPMASPSSPTPSSGSETGPRAYTRRNR